MFGSSINRPRNWYDMSYEQQRDWQKREDDHRYEVERQEREARDAREEAERNEERLQRARREFASEREEYSDENSRLSEDLDNITAERDGLCDVVRRLRKALISYAKPDIGWAEVEHADAYEASTILVPLDESEATP